MKKQIKWMIAQFVEIRWWQNLNNSTSNNYPERKALYWRNLLDIISKFVSINQSDFILDVGCGPSSIYMILNNKMDAVDPLLSKYETKISFFSQKKYPNINFYSVPFEIFETQNKYDKIFCFNALNHFNNLHFSTSRIHELLKENGYLIVGVDVHKYLLLKKIFKFTGIDILHPHQLDYNDYLSLFLTTGFKLIHTEILKKKRLFNYSLFILHK